MPPKKNNSKTLAKRVGLSNFTTWFTTRFHDSSNISLGFLDFLQYEVACYSASSASASTMASSAMAPEAPFHPTRWVDRLGQSNLRLNVLVYQPLNGQMFLGVVLSTLTLPLLLAGCWSRSEEVKQTHGECQVGSIQMWLLEMDGGSGDLTQYQACAEANFDNVAQARNTSQLGFDQELIEISKGCSKWKSQISSCRQLHLVRLYGSMLEWIAVDRLL